MLLIKNGRVVDPASKTDAALDILVDGEKIKEVGPAGKVLAPQGTELFDASGLIVAPGFIDIHAHLREPGQESSETIETGTRAAARGGIVAVSDDGRPIATAKLARQVMDYCRSLELPVIEHSEDVSLAAGAVMREGVTSTRLGLRGMPAEAESVCVARDLHLAELTGARLHVAHLSAKASLEQVRWAKSRGLRVTCEVTPHHFTLIDEDVEYDSRFKMNPPLAAREDREA